MEAENAEESARITDEVSVLQEAVDLLALRMFDSLRLIPFASDVEHKGVEAGQPASAAAAANNGGAITTVKRAVATNAAWENRVQSLAEGVVNQARALDRLLNTLPGADLREDQQMEELARLDQEARRKRTELAKMVKRAAELSEGVNNRLDKLAEHMLAAPR